VFLLSVGLITAPALVMNRLAAIAYPIWSLKAAPQP
jgi:hypothetical protein